MHDGTVRGGRMVGDPVITEEMRGLIGVETPPYYVEVEKGDLRRFVEATGETHPLYIDAEWAKTTRYGSVIFPPTFFCPDPIITAKLAGLARPWPFQYSIDGGSEWEFCRPVRVGDRLSLTARIADLYEKQGSPQRGRMLFTIIEVRCVNQDGELVGIARGTGIVYEGSAGGGEEAAA
jgi:acyl dehydratase